MSTDERPRVTARVTDAEVAAFRQRRSAAASVRDGRHAFYALGGGRFRATLEPATYRLLRALGFRGVAITDSMNIVSSPPAYWPAKAMRAGADMLL